MSNSSYPQMSAFAGFGEFITFDSDNQYEIVNGPVYFNQSLPNGLINSINDISAIKLADQDDRLSTLKIDFDSIQEPTSTSLSQQPIPTPSTDMEGWVDIRGFVRLSVLAALDAGATGANFVVEFKRGSFDPNPVEIVASTPGVLGDAVLLFDDSVEYYSQVRVLVSGAPAAGNNNFGLVNILGK